MHYYHVIAKTKKDENYQCLFFDLSAEDLKKRFVKPYHSGKSYFSLNNVIAPTTLVSLQIIRTERKAEIELDELSKAYTARIDKDNHAHDAQFFVIGLGYYGMQDIAEAGEDVTHSFIKGPPGHKNIIIAMSHTMLKPVGTVATGMLVGYIIWKMGWI